MSEPRSFPAAGPNTTRRTPDYSESPPRPRQTLRWRDIQWIEFETSPAVPDEPAQVEPVQTEIAVPAQPPEPPQPVPDQEDAPAPVRAPRYGRAIAPLPRYLIASLPAPPHAKVTPAGVTLRRPAAMPSKQAVPRGGSFPRRPAYDGRRRRSRLAAVIVFGAAVIFAAYFNGDLVAGFAKGKTAPSPPLPADPVPVRHAAAAATPAPAPAAARPSPAEQAVGVLSRAKDGDVDAQYDIAVRYARGDGVPQDYAAAATWFREAAIKNDAAAQYDLGVLYERGLGLIQDMNEALIWYHSAAAQNYPAAEYNLAISYANGRGTPRDLIAAARWYLRAAEQGVVPAMVNFAILSENGDGTVRSPSTAYAWYRAAANRGDQAGAKRADELLRRFSDDDRKSAEAEAAAVAASIHQAQAQPLATPAAAPAPRPAAPGNASGGASGASGHAGQTPAGQAPG